MTRFTKSKIIAQLREQFVVAKDKDIAEQLPKKIDEFESECRLRLIKEDPFEEHRAVLASARNDFRKKIFDLPAIQSDLKSYLALAKQVGLSATDESFWNDGLCEIEKQEAYSNRIERIAEKLSRSGRVKKLPADTREKTAQDRQILRGLLQEKWGKLLDEAHFKWQMEKIDEYRREFFARLEEWLRLLQQLAGAMRQLSMTPGFLFDLSQDGLSFSDIEEMRRWAEYLSQDKNAQKLCEMLGRMRMAKRSKREEWIKTTETISEVRIDINSREEIVGVCAGNSIEHALVPEKSLLADEDIAMLFYLKFAENRLMQFEMQGLMKTDIVVQTDTLTEVSEEDEMGPLIICVDTSGSMHGAPETIAKAVTLYLASTAASQKRDCYLINFSTQIETMDLSGHVSLRKLIKFLGVSFHGGTDVAPAVEHGLKMMQKENYRKADMLVVSDFLMNELPENVRTEVLAAGENDNKLYSLVIGESFIKNPLHDLFTREWGYDPQTGSIRHLLDIADVALDRTD